MAGRAVQVARAVAVMGGVAGLLLLARPGGRTAWHQAFPGGEFALLSGEPWCRQGPSRVAVLRIDPRRVSVRVRHFADQPDLRPLTITQWQRRTGAVAVFNAGQFYPDWSYMGLLVSGGRVVSGRTHPGYRAALVADPRRGGRAARVLDLDRDSLRADALDWNEVAQSFMLFERGGSLRVRRSDHIAHRTAVGEDDHGRLVIVTSEGGYTLGDFAEMLQRLPLGLTHAMSMDGGLEAELCVKAGSFRYASFGRWENDVDAAATPGGQTLLPAVVTVEAP